MASRSSYTPVRLREIGRRSADQARNDLERAVMARVTSLTCEYCGVATADGSVNLDAAVRASSYVVYRWAVIGDGFDQQHEVRVRMDKAASNGIAFPKGWKTALQNLDIPDVVRRQVERAKAESRVAGLSCRLLGSPARVTTPKEEGHYVGTVVSISGVAAVLCARVTADQWLCHRGSCTQECEPDSEKPWQPKDLDICDLANADKGAQRKRIRTHLLGAQLRMMVEQYPRAFAEVAAVAAFRAEQKLAASEGRDLDVTGVAKHFEPMAWHWPERAWDVNVFLLWSWHCRGILRTALSGVRLDHLRDLERKLSVPEGLGDAEYCLWRSLEQVAEAETAARKAPCRYLGVKLDGDKYCADPSRWIRAQHYPDGHRSHTVVCFEWRHVTCSNGRPHVVEIRADHVLDKSRDRRSPPHNPLDPNAVGAGFRFDVEFMRKVGVNVHPAVQYKGICFDAGERPELRVQVPDGGLNIHNEPVAWALRDGRVVEWSLLQLREKRPDELIESNSHEAYRDVAKELGWQMYRVFFSMCVWSVYALVLLASLASTFPITRIRLL